MGAPNIQWGPWIDWPGGDCPLERGTLCEVMSINGETMVCRALISGDVPPVPSDEGLSWRAPWVRSSEGHLVIPIIAYRLPVDGDGGGGSVACSVEVAA